VRTRGVRGQEEGKDERRARTRGGRGREGEDETTRKEWDRSRGVEGVEERWNLWGETCSARRSRVVEGDRCREGLLSTERWASDREFVSLEQR
jgi:hypothetical protein